METFTGSRLRWTDRRGRHRDRRRRRRARRDRARRRPHVDRRPLRRPHAPATAPFRMRYAIDCATRIGEHWWIVGPLSARLLTTGPDAGGYEKGGSGRVLGECHGVAEGSEALGVIPQEAVRVEAIEVAAAQLAIRLAVAEHVGGDHEDAVGDGDDGLLVAAPLDEAP